MTYRRTELPVSTFHRALACVLAGLLVWVWGCGDQNPQKDNETGRVVTERAAEDPYAQGIACQDSGDLQGALEQFTRAIDTNHPKLAASYASRGETYKALGRMDQALADFDTAIRIEPQNPNLYMHRAVLHQVRGQLDPAMQDCNRALELDHEGKLPGAFSFRANLHIALGEYEKAVADCNEALRRKPTLYTAYVNRGVARERLNQLDLAVADYSEAIKLSPQSAGPRRNRGVVHARRGALDEALADFTKAIQIDPTDLLAYDNRGALYLQRGEAKKAIVDFTRAIQFVEQSRRRSGGKLRPGKMIARVYALRAEAYRRLGDRQRAMADCQRALEIDADCRQAKAVRAMIESERAGEAGDHGEP